MCVRLKALILSAVVLIVVFSGSAWAAFKPKVSIDSNGSVSSVLINNFPAIRFQKGITGLSASERAGVTASRLHDLIEKGADSNSFLIKDEKHQARILCGNSIVCVVTEADAKAAKSSPIALASSWAYNIKKLMNLPAITLSTKELTVPLGEFRKVDIGGAAEGQITVKPAASGIVKITASIDGDYVQVAGQQVGSTTIEFSVQGEKVYLPVTVMKYAGNAETVSVAKVTGNPCPESVLCYAARQAVKQSVKVEPGANLEILNVKCGGRGLAQNQARSVKVGVKISGAGYLTYNGYAEVMVQNKVVKHGKLSMLLYSNNPERLLKYQTLFAGKLDQNGATRVLYHHQNMMGKRVQLTVEIINPNPVSASVRIVRGAADPMVDTVLVGHVAGNEFLREMASDVSVIENIPPQSRLILVSNMLKNGETASGIFQLTQLEGQTTYLRVNALVPGMEDVAEGDIVPASNMLVMKLSDDIYPSPVRDLEADYRVGDRWAFISLGKHAINDSTLQKKLYGNYGVTYNINVKVENPTANTKKVSIVFDPTAGIASGVFIIDGKFCLKKHAQPPSEYTLTTYRLKPGEIRNVRIVTVPLAGSNYPATLVVRS